jgi:hypothetical protein
LEDPGVDGRIILNLIYERLVGGIEGFYVAQARDRWRALEMQ